MSKADATKKAVMIITETEPGQYAAQSVADVATSVKILRMIEESYIRGDERRKIEAQNTNQIINPNTGVAHMEPVAGEQTH
ncbi:MAG: hypothetical protein GY820_38715 [Gammaproteobacteria bacterium]|nr:hypothetical protein [Gammaproteobacteria bacterium]